MNDFQYMKAVQKAWDDRGQYQSWPQDWESITVPLYQPSWPKRFDDSEETVTFVRSHYHDEFGRRIETVETDGGIIVRETYP